MGLGKWMRPYAYVYPFIELRPGLSCTWAADDNLRGHCGGDGPLPSSMGSAKGLTLSAVRPQSRTPIAREKCPAGAFADKTPSAIIGNGSPAATDL